MKSRYSLVALQMKLVSNKSNAPGGSSCFTLQLPRQFGLLNPFLPCKEATVHSNSPPTPVGLIWLSGPAENPSGRLHVGLSLSPFPRSACSRRAAMPLQRADGATRGHATVRGTLRSR